MPQFDIVIYSNEVLWVFFFFLLMYSFNYLFFFPRMAEILKTRKKKVEMDLLQLDLLDKKFNSLFLKKESMFFEKILLNSFVDYKTFSFVIGFFEKINSLSYNLTVKYYLGYFYNYFDFYELESI